MGQRQHMIGVRVDPALHQEIKAEADRRFGGYESLVLREATKTYLRLRRSLGPQYEPVIGTLTGAERQEQEEGVTA